MIDQSPAPKRHIPAVADAAGSANINSASSYPAVTGADAAARTELSSKGSVP